MRLEPKGVIRGHYKLQGAFMTDQQSQYANGKGLSLRQAALIAGFGILIMAFCAPFANFYAFSRLIIDGDAVATAENILQNPRLFLYGALAYFITYLCDILVAWGLYYLLRPASPAGSLLAAWMRLVYTGLAFLGLFNILAAYRILTVEHFEIALGTDGVQAQAYALLQSAESMSYIALTFFGVHLFVLGLVALRARYIPSVLGVLLMIAGLGYIVYNVGVYAAPSVDLGLLFVTFFGELIFMLWLLIAGWTLRSPET